MAKTTAKMIIAFGCIVKPLFPAGGLLVVAGGTCEVFPGADVFCACFLEGGGAPFAPGAVLVDG